MALKPFLAMQRVKVYFIDWKACALLTYLLKDQCQYSNKNHGLGKKMDLFSKSFESSVYKI